MVSVFSKDYEQRLVRIYPSNGNYVIFGLLGAFGNLDQEGGFGIFQISSKMLLHIQIL